MLRIALGYLASLAVSALMITMTINKGTFAGEFLAAMVLELIFTILPFVACTSIAHIYRIRNPLYYAAWGIVPVLLVGLLFGFCRAMMDTFLVPAMLGGGVYWLVAGRLAGPPVAAQ